MITRALSFGPFVLARHPPKDFLVLTAPDFPPLNRYPFPPGLKLTPLLATVTPRALSTVSKRFIHFPDFLNNPAPPTTIAGVCSLSPLNSSLFVEFFFFFFLFVFFLIFS